MRKKKTGKKRDLIAKDLMTNKYRQRIVPNKKKKLKKFDWKKQQGDNRIIDMVDYSVIAFFIYLNPCFKNVFNALCFSSFDIAKISFVRFKMLFLFSISSLFIICKRSLFSLFSYGSLKLNNFFKHLSKSKNIFHRYKITYYDCFYIC